MVNKDVDAASTRLLSDQLKTVAVHDFVDSQIKCKTILIAKQNLEFQYLPSLVIETTNNQCQNSGTLADDEIDKLLSEVVLPNGYDSISNEDNEEYKQQILEFLNENKV